MKNQNQINLNYYQMMSFIFKVEEMKKENENFNDENIILFSNYLITRTEEIVMKYPFFSNKITKNLKLYAVSKELYAYLVNFTSVNPLDPNTLNIYKPIIKEFDNNLMLKIKADWEECERDVKKKFKSLKKKH